MIAERFPEYFCVQSRSSDFRLLPVAFTFRQIPPNNGDAFFEQGGGYVVHIGSRLMDGMWVDSAITEAATCRRLVKQSDCFLNALKRNDKCAFLCPATIFFKFDPPPDRRAICERRLLSYTVDALSASHHRLRGGRQKGLLL
ncbi:hypothetical protein CEXT_613901 [Caerostris extrusa]|uniref:Uncharacterized protein n=1 Tax=Caerostris extrusa TaxID=172846 RepID=A0AAV4NDF5_CAEEX|nr:hypothetical protein CEXT_613901 [Caerostris extrusa]